MDMSTTEKSLDNINTFFSKPAGKAIHKYLKDAKKEGNNLNDALRELGLSLSDIGAFSLSDLEEYFNRADSAVKKAKNSVDDYRKGVGDIEKATESANQDKDWSTVQQAYATAKDMRKKGKTGTDDFQNMVQFLSPKNLEKAAKNAAKAGGYAADVYQKEFDRLKGVGNRWFGENEEKSLTNFITDFQGKGLFDVQTDEMGLLDISTKFKTTAEAADKMGVSVQAVETMLSSLEAYGYDFDHADRKIVRSGELLTDYKQSLQGIKDVYDSMEDGDSKKQLGTLIKGFDGEYKKFNKDLTKLTKKKVIA